MRTLLNCFGVLCVVGAVLAGTAGCSSEHGGLPDDVVAEIGSHAISKAMLAHWARVEGALAYGVAPGHASPVWVMPEPPAYEACIARLKRSKSRPTGRTGSTRAQFKGRCEREYRELQRKVLSYLIQTIWYKGMADEEGVSLTSAELNREFQKIIQREYPRQGTFQRYLASAGMSASDELLRVRTNLLETKLRQKVERELRAVKGHGPREREQQLRLVIGSTGKWLAKTNCRPGYVVLFCRQYRGPQRL